jgi:inorganic pyrophosphatase
MNAVAEQLKAATSKREAAARKVWKEAVIAAAEGREPTDKQLEQLADARHTLGRTAEQFNEHVTTWQVHAAEMELQASLPTRAEDAAEWKRIEARIKEIDAETERLKAERNEIAARYHHAIGKDRVYSELRAAEAVKKCPELFAAD